MDPVERNSRERDNVPANVPWSDGVRSETHRLAGEVVDCIEGIPTELRWESWVLESYNDKTKKFIVTVIRCEKQCQPVLAKS